MINVISVGRSLGRISLLAALVVALALAGGCAAFGGSAGPEEKVEALEVHAPLREPVWVPGKDTLLALEEEEPRVVLVDPEASGSSVVAHSREFGGVGENVALNVRAPDQAYLPRSGQGEISVLSTEDLRRLGSLDAGGSPARVTVDAASEILFALSEDGSVVRGIDLEGSREIPPVEVGRGQRTLLEAPEKGLYPAFWVAGSRGLAHYTGDPPERKASMEMEAGDIAVDPVSAQRAYVAEAGTGRVAAVEGDAEALLEGDLEVVVERTLGERVEHIAVGELFVYAATRERLVVMRRHDLKTYETTEYREPLERDPLKSAGISGLTVGKERVYLTLGGEPYLLSVDKP